MKVSEIIDQYLKPRLREECERLGIPVEFILSLKAGYCKPFEYCSRCDPVDEQGNFIYTYQENMTNVEISGVHIKLGDCNDEKPRRALSELRHELRHAKDWYDGTSYIGMSQDEKRKGESRANWYARRRALEDFITFVKKKIITSSITHL